MHELWPGADVRWVGSARSASGVQLREGDRAVVVDPGRHAVRSFGALYHAEGERPPRPGRGVVIRVSGDAIVKVSRRHLELVEPDHPLRPEPDARAADWFLQRLEPWGKGFASVASLVPRDFPAVARVFHPWTGEGGPPATGELDPETARALVDVLARFTSTPDDVYVAVWVGWGDVLPQRFPGAAEIPTEARGHFLLRGPLDGVLTPVAVGSRDRPASGIWWPADRAWLVVTEIDFEWTFVGGSDALVEALVRDPRLEVTRSHPDNPAHLPEATA